MECFFGGGGGELSMDIVINLCVILKGNVDFCSNLKRGGGINICAILKGDVDFCSNLKSGRDINFCAKPKGWCQF